MSSCTLTFWVCQFPTIMPRLALSLSHQRSQQMVEDLLIWERARLSLPPFVLPARQHQYVLSRFRQTFHSPTWIPFFYAGTIPHHWGVKISTKVWAETPGSPKKCWCLIPGPWPSGTGALKVQRTVLGGALLHNSDWSVFVGFHNNNLYWRTPLLPLFPLSAHWQGSFRLSSGSWCCFYLKTREKNKQITFLAKNPRVKELKYEDIFCFIF